MTQEEMEQLVRQEQSSSGTLANRAYWIQAVRWVHWILEIEVRAQNLRKHLSFLNLVQLRVKDFEVSHQVVQSFSHAASEQPKSRF